METDCNMTNINREGFKKKVRLLSAPSMKALCIHQASFITFLTTPTTLIQYEDYHRSLEEYRCPRLLAHQQHTTSSRSYWTVAIR